MGTSSSTALVGSKAKVIKFTWTHNYPKHSMNSYYNKSLYTDTANKPFYPWFILASTHMYNGGVDDVFGFTIG